MTTMTTPRTTGARPAAMRTGSRRRTRNLVRIAHLVAGGVLGTYVYAPDAITEAMQLPLQVAGIPLASLTGMYLWKPSWFRRQRPSAGAR